MLNFFIGLSGLQLAADSSHDYVEYCAVQCVAVFMDMQWRLLDILATFYMILGTLAIVPTTPGMRRWTVT